VRLQSNLNVKKFSFYHILVIITFSVWMGSSFYGFTFFDSASVFKQASTLLSAVCSSVFLLYIVKRNSFLMEKLALECEKCYSRIDESDDYCSNCGKETRI
jgi:high-affinity nickel permease